MPALLKTTQIQEPSSASVNIQLDSSGNVALVPTAGNVGIGTTSPGAKLEVSSTSNIIQSTGTGGYGAFYAKGSGTNSSYLFLGNGNGEQGRITSENGGAITFSNTSSPTERMRITANGGVSFGSSGTAYGTSGQYLKSNGDAAPSWATLSATGALIRAPQILTSGTSYTTPSNCTAIYVEAVGGGGNGGSGQGTASFGSGGGGGSAGYCAKYFTVTGSTAYTYAIGAATGNTTFTVGATTITAGGGSTGGSANNAAGSGGAGGSATNGDLNIAGQTGSVGGGGSTLTGLSGTGGSTIFGLGGLAPGLNNSGRNGTGYGSGGSGGNSSSSASLGGGSGTQGVIRIWEFT